MSSIYIHQPDFAPWLAYFIRAHNADQLVILDHVQFPKKGWVHRDRILNKKQEQWLSVPIAKCQRFTPISKIRLADTNWRQNHLNLLHECYRHEKNFYKFFEVLNNYYNKLNQDFCSFNIGLHDEILKYLDIQPFVNKRIFSSHYSWKTKGSDLMLEISGKFNASTYISGNGADDYINKEAFEKNRVKMGDFMSKIGNGKNFNLSCLHYLFIKEKEYISDLIQGASLCHR